MVQHDSELGWILTPGWKGRHRHHDFNVSYAINDHGFRADAAWPTGHTGKLLAVVGDSFTFGLGVNDTETFVHHLNRLSTNRYINCAIPGYSTDQEALLIEREVLDLKPDGILLVVYLGNDLFDNQFSRPLQLKASKPRFELSDNQLILRHPPVSRTDETAAEPGGDLACLVLGEHHRKTWRARFERHSALCRVASENLLPQPPMPADFNARTAPAVVLTARILNHIRQRCEGAGVRFQIALLAGRSFFERPASVSEQYQEAFRCKLLEECARSGIAAVDLASLLKQKRRSASAHWFYHADGHLTPAGHEVAGQILAGITW